MTDIKYHCIHFIFKVILSLAIGVVVSFVAMQYDGRLKLVLEKQVQAALELSLYCDVSCKIDSINFLYPAVKCSHIKMKAYDSSWKWKSCSIEMGFSWWDVFFSGVAEIYVSIEDIKIYSLTQKEGLAIMPYIISFLEGPSFGVPMILKSFNIKSGILSIFNDQMNVFWDIYFSSMTKNILGVYKSKILFSRGSVSVWQKDILDRLSGVVHISMEQKSGSMYTNVDANCSFNNLFLRENKTCFLTGSWAYDQGLFSIISQDKSFCITPIKLYFLGETLFTEVNLESNISDFSGFLFAKSNDLSGKCCFKLATEFGPIASGLSGSIVCKDVCYQGCELFSFGRIACKKTSNNYKGFLSLSRKDGVIINGGFNFSDEDNRFLFKAVNDTDISIAAFQDWKIKSKKAKLHVSYNNTDGLKGACSCDLFSEKLESNINIFSDASIGQSICSFEGNLGDKTYVLDLLFTPQLRVKKCIFKDKYNKNIFYMRALENNPDKFVLSVTFPFLKELAKEYCNMDIQGEGDLKVYGFCKEDLLLCQLNFKKGSASFPGFYNFLDNLKVNCVFDPSQQVCIVKDAKAKLHKGSISCKRAFLRYGTSFYQTFIYAPLVFDNCFVNWSNDLFALCSGRLLFLKKEKSFFMLQGVTIIERSQLKRNIFSQNSDDSVVKAENSFLNDVNCNISVVTKSVARMQMPFLKSAANIDLSLTGKLFDPHIAGKIDFVSGALLFPYKPLYIAKGTMYFLPHQSQDPLIDLRAKNKINKYNIAMCITGSFSDYHISLESTPSLSEEQIFALLIAGSAQESLNIVAPALIMQQVRDSLFGSSESGISKKSYFGKFLKPFRNVHIVPSFADQTGRGGLRGAIEVDINNRWRAFVQKNFSLSEDTRFEIECFLSDNVSVRGFRRENGDIGSDVEMRWKF